MVKFTATIHRDDTSAEKTGWTFINITPDLGEKLQPDSKKGFRVKGKIDNLAIKGVSVMPVGGGNYVLPINAEMRKALGKKKGAMVKVQIQKDYEVKKINADLLECLADEPVALANFNKLPRSHQLYFSNWIESAKTEPTKAKRIEQTVTGMRRGILNYGELIRSLRDEKL